ncbi:MAG TPA: hypothetical protein VKG26_15380, partial [Bacteroidia bacterium]|nr:hypothetical protein [Bacteroidia bacterium]
MRRLFILSQLLFWYLNVNALNIPYFFVKNNGQLAKEISYNLKTPGANVFFLADRFVYQFTEKARTNFADTNLLEYENIEVRFVNPSLKSFFSEENVLPSKTNYFIGNKQSEWVTDIENFQTLVYNDIYKGINLKYYSKNNRLKYDFVLSPQADISDIKLEFSGQQSIQLKEGKLQIMGKYRKLVENIPVAYQIIDGKKVEVQVQYVLQNNRVGFSCASYNKAYALVIDPILFYSTFVGGSGDDVYGTGALKKDKSGNVYTAGYTSSTNFPITPGAYDASYNGGSYDACIFKLNSTGTALIYSTYIGGSDFDRINGMLLDTNTLELYVCGDSFSGNFPSTTGVYQSTNASVSSAGGADAFLVRLTPSGNSLVFSTFIGAVNDDKAIAMVFDSQHNIYLTGESQSPAWPTTAGTYDVSWNGSFDVTVWKMDDMGTSLLASTFVGGSGAEIGGAIALDNNSNVYITIHTQGNNFPVTPGAFDQTFNGGGYDAGAIKLNSTLSTLIYATYLGGSGDDIVRDQIHV